MTTSGDGRPPKTPGREGNAPRLPRRTYASVSVGPVEKEGIAVLLDGRTARTPRKAALRLPTLALARAIAGEWAAQEDRIDPSRMPMTRLANTAIDGVTGREAEVRADIVRYAASDLVCYRATGPEGLVGRQSELWGPVLSWARDRHGADLVVQFGVMPVAQPAASRTAIETAVAGLDAFRLTALHAMTTLTGSALLALGLLDGAWTAEAAWTAAHVDEDWQIAQWGEDAEAKARRERRRIEMGAAARLLALLAG